MILHGNKYSFYKETNSLNKLSNTQTQLYVRVKKQREKEIDMHKFLNFNPMPIFKITTAM